MKVRILIVLGIAGFAAIIFFAGNQMERLSRAHSTFENYYAFRGCRELLDKKDNYGICKTGEGQAIKIVKYKEKWYLDGDLPICISSVCF
jgi:hypothetical protein